MARSGPPFRPPKSPRTQEMRHINFFLGAQNGGFGRGPKSWCWKSLCAFSVGYTRQAREIYNFGAPVSTGREGANREKLTMKKIISNEMLFFTVYVPYKPWKTLRKPWKNRHQKSTIFSPLVFHRLRPHELDFLNLPQWILRAFSPLILLCSGVRQSPPEVRAEKIGTG